MKLLLATILILSTIFCNAQIVPRRTANIGNTTPPPVAQGCTPPVATNYLSLPQYPGAFGLPSGTGFLNGVTNTTISGYKFTNTNPGINNGRGLVLQNCSNITIENCLFNTCYDMGAYFLNCSNITFRNNVVANCSWGTNSQGCTGGMKFFNNEFYGMYGAHTAGQCCRGQAIYFISCSGPNNWVGWNRIINFFGDNWNNDIIAMYSSGGTSGSPFRISSNIIWGGGPARYGVSIIVGDGPSGNVNAVIDSNRVFMPAITGIGVAGGFFVTATRNMVWGEETEWSGGGYYAYKNPANCGNIDMSTSNRTWVIDRNGGKNDAFFNGTCSNCTCGVSTLGTDINNAYSIITAGIGDPRLYSLLLCQDDVWRIRSDTTWDWQLSKFGTVLSGGPDDRAVPWNYTDVRKPISNAGPDQVVSGTSVTLNGSSSAAQNPLPPMTGTNTITYRWVLVTAPNSPTIVSPTSVTTNVTGLVAGTYLFRLEVTQVNVWNNNNFSDNYNYTTQQSDHITVVKT